MTLRRKIQVAVSACVWVATKPTDHQSEYVLTRDDTVGLFAFVFPFVFQWYNFGCPGLYTEICLAGAGCRCWKRFKSCGNRQLLWWVGYGSKVFLGHQHAAKWWCRDYFWRKITASAHHKPQENHGMTLPAKPLINIRKSRSCSLWLGLSSVVSEYYGIMLVQDDFKNPSGRVPDCSCSRTTLAYHINLY